MNPDADSDLDSAADSGRDLERVLARLDAEQLAAVTAPVGPVVVMAGAGSGKTRVLTARIAYRVAQKTAAPPHVVAFTFTRQAAGELQRRLVAMGLGRDVVAGTFHGVAYRILRRRWEDQGRSEPPTLLTNRIEAVTEMLAGDRRTAVQAVGEIEWARARLVDADQYLTAATRAGRKPSLPAERVAEVYRAFEEWKRRTRTLDFDDLLSRCTAELRRPGVAAAVAWWHRHLHVDEYQDINPLQQAFLDALRNGGTDLFIVGDAAQAIYGWNGADPTLLTDLEDSDLRPTVVTLGRNFRSAPEVVAAADRVLTTNHLPGAHVAARPTTGSVTTIAADDEADEARQIVRLASRLREPGAPWRTVAVLARTNALVRDLAGAFAAAGIPARVVTRARAGAPPAFVRAARGAADTDELHTLAADLVWDDAPEPHDAGLDVRAALELVRDFERVGGGSGRAFASWVALHSDAAEPQGDAVELVTMHAAKGREWPAVIVAGVDKVAFPAPGGPRSPARAEEARLLYVAMTRAEDRLAITWCERRGGRAAGRSPLLPDLTPDTVDESAAPFTPVLALRRPAPAVDHTLDALVQWRARAAKAAGVPPTFVVDDAALAEIAARRPADIDALEPIIGLLAARRLGPRLLAVLEEQRLSAR